AKLFTDENYLGDGVYRVPPELVCAETDYDPSGNPITVIDPECANNLELAQLRVRVETSGSALRFAIQIDPNHDEPLVFSLTHDSLGVTVDLDDAEDAMISLAQLFGEQAPNARMAGQVTGMLEVLGAAHVRSSLDIDRSLDVAFAEQGIDLDGPDAVRLASKAAHVFAIEL